MDKLLNRTVGAEAGPELLRPPVHRSTAIDPTIFPEKRIRSSNHFWGKSAPKSKQAGQDSFPKVGNPTCLTRPQLRPGRPIVEKNDLSTAPIRFHHVFPPPFSQKRLVKFSKIQDTPATLIPRSAEKFPAYQAATRMINIMTRPKKVPSDAVNVIDDPNR